jgi:glycosyltransferase involved in cell wall biosynthesis
VRFSIVIPARDEEAHLAGCLDALRRAAAGYDGEVEVIVVLNRCTDATERIAQAWGARTVREDAPNLARIRNRGAAEAAGEVLVTVDADSRMSENALREIDRALRSGWYVGGGVSVRPERLSAGILASWAILRLMLLVTGLGGGLFWCYRRDFAAIGGFDEALLVAEDLDFARRLRAHGRSRGLRFTTLRAVALVTSCRKFDRFGDWFLLKELLLHGRRIRRALRAEDRDFADRYFYDFPR